MKGAKKQRFNYSFAIINDKEKQKILTDQRSEPANVWQLKNDWNNSPVIKKKLVINLNLIQLIN